jgi:hypothetical protein
MRVLVCLALATALVCCNSRKVEQCARLRTVLLAQSRTHDELSEHLRDAQSCEAQALRLKAQVAELRALHVLDTALADALRHYLTGLEALADAYGRVARAHRSRPDGAGATTPNELQALAAGLLAHADAVDRASLSLLHVCRGS